MKEWKNVKLTSKGQEYVEPCELKTGLRSSSRAVFFRNTHQTTGEKIVSLKIARYRKVNGTFYEKQDKSITLSCGEIDKLIEYIQEYYAPLNTGMSEFISVDKDAAELFAKVRDLGIPDAEVVKKLHESGILTENLSVAITAAERNRAVSEFEQAISSGYPESYWQDWFSRNKWVLGSEYLNILPERDIDVTDIADYLMRAIDGFLDVVEIKRPDLPFWTRPDSHGNLCPSSQLTAAITQCLNYLYKIELQSNSVEFMERVEDTKTVKPQCMLVYGRSVDWDDNELKSLRILNAAYHQLHIITYDQLLMRAKLLLGIENETADEEEDFSEWPF
ncbi:Shedu immune nuclease family protein [Intestinimonas butyriciproducens]|uniref:Shedu immune nuclease family protein n=1 Tax=Intestinimonas butyriciproducens TaxID=1297617 RepID=UPI000334B92E|nr:Shedu immune nuclease family protein [Intestinimonas butyriciproducens]CDD45156.1 putative uncharacterized protein [Clostridium sp. CAG:299]